MFSDGDDRHSVGRRDESLRRIEEGQVVLYTVGFGDGGSEKFRQTLTAFAEASGGRAFFPRRAAGSRSDIRSDPRGVVAPVHPVLRALGRAPPDGSWRTLEIRPPRGLPGRRGRAIVPRIGDRRRMGMCAVAIVASNRLVRPNAAQPDPASPDAARAAAIRSQPVVAEKKNIAPQKIANCERLAAPGPGLGPEDRLHDERVDRVADRRVASGRDRRLAPARDELDPGERQQRDRRRVAAPALGIGADARGGSRATG